MPADLHGRAGIAPLAEHLVEPRGAQAGILRQGVADERQKRVKGARAAHAPAEGNYIQTLTPPSTYRNLLLRHDHG